MITKRGTNQHRVRYGLDYKTKARVFMCLCFALVVGYMGNLSVQEEQFWNNLVSPLGEPVFAKDLVTTPTPTPKPLTVDEMVHKYAEKHGKKGKYTKNQLKALTHYLLLREQDYGGSDSCGDQGMACGPMQFWEDTYIANRNAMIKKGLAQELGSRFNMDNALDTAMYMFSIGQEKQWGPVLRQEIKL